MSYKVPVFLEIGQACHIMTTPNNVMIYLRNTCRYLMMTIVTKVIFMNLAKYIKEKGMN